MDAISAETNKYKQGSPPVAAVPLAAISWPTIRSPLQASVAQYWNNQCQSLRVYSTPGPYSTRNHPCRMEGVERIKNSDIKDVDGWYYNKIVGATGTINKKRAAECMTVIDS